MLITWQNHIVRKLFTGGPINNYCRKTTQTIPDICVFLPSRCEMNTYVEYLWQRTTHARRVRTHRWGRCGSWEHRWGLRPEILFHTSKCLFSSLKTHLISPDPFTSTKAETPTRFNQYAPFLSHPCEGHAHSKSVGWLIERWAPVHWDALWQIGLRVVFIYKVQGGNELNVGKEHLISFITSAVSGNAGTGRGEGWCVGRRKES